MRDLEAPKLYSPLRWLRFQWEVGERGWPMYMPTHTRAMARHRVMNQLWCRANLDAPGELADALGDANLSEMARAAVTPQDWAKCAVALTEAYGHTFDEWLDRRTWILQDDRRRWTSPPTPRSE